MAARCERFRRLVSLSLDGPLPEDLDRELGNHLAGCPSCREFQREVAGILSSLEGAPSQGPDPSRLASLVASRLAGERREERRHSFPARPAAALLAGVLLYLLFFLPSGGSSFPDPVLRIHGLVRLGAGGLVHAPRLEGLAATLFLADRSVLDLEGGTTLLFRRPGKGERIRVFLEEGKLTAYVSHGPGRFLVETRAGAAEALGTSFEVEVINKRINQKEKRKTTMRKKKKALPGTIMKVAVLAGSVLLHTAWGRETLGPGRKKEITTWSARGRVVDQAGRPVKGARVWVDNGEPFQSMVGERPPAIPWRTFHEKALFSNWLLKGPFTAGPAVTGGDGRFLVPNVPSPLKGRILVLHPEFLEKVVPVRRGWIAGDGRVDAGTIRLERGLSISGTVLEADGSPAAGARVALAFDRRTMRYEDQPGALRMTRTDEKGRFAIRGIDPAWRHLVLGCWQKGGLILEKPLDLSGSPADLKLVLPPGKGLTLSVKALEAPSGRPLPGSVGLVYDVRDPGLAVPLARTTAGEDGSLLLGGLPPGEVKLLVVPPDQAGKAGVWSSPPYSPQKTVQAGSALVCPLDPPVGVEGKVLDGATGRPVERFRLEAHPAWSWFDLAYRKRFGHPDSPSLPGNRYRRDGLFSLPSLRAGKWKLFVCANGYHPLERDLDLTAGGKKEIQVALQPATGIMDGIVVDSKGAPMEGALVEGYEWSPRHYGLNRVRKTTGRDGSFHLDRLLMDTGIVLKVWVRKEGFLKKEIAFKKGEPRPPSLGRIMLTRECVLTGRIVDEGGNPLDRLSIRLLGREFKGKRARSALTDDQGRFLFKGLPAGKYRLVLEGKKLAQVELPRPGARVDLPEMKWVRRGR